MADSEKILYFEPKSIVVGIGSRKGLSREMLYAAVKETLEENHLTIGMVRAFACVKNRYNEEGICGLSRKLGIPVFAYEVEDLEPYLKHSSICEQVVFALCKEISVFSRMLFKKRIENGIILTVAVIWRK